MSTTARMYCIAMFLFIGLPIATPLHAAPPIEEILCRGPLSFQTTFSTSLDLLFKPNSAEAGPDGRFLAPGTCQHAKAPLLPKQSGLLRLSAAPKSTMSIPVTFATTLIHLCTSDSRCVLRFEGSFNGVQVGAIKIKMIDISRLKIKTFYPRFKASAPIKNLRKAKPGGAKFR